MESDLGLYYFTADRRNDAMRGEISPALGNEERAVGNAAHEIIIFFSSPISMLSLPPSLRMLCAMG